MSQSPMPTPNLEGMPVYGFKLSENQFVARMQTAQLLTLVSDPRKMEKADEREGNPKAEELHAMRMEVQRLFSENRSKAQNVEPYAHYIVNVTRGEDGITPEVVLWTPVDLPVPQEHLAVLPWTAKFQLVSIDGETQVAARHEAIKIEDKVANEYVVVRICHGLPMTWARQAFRDLNTLGVKVSTSLALAMDNRDPVTSITRVVGELPFFSGRVNTSARSLKKKDTKIVTFSALRGAVVTLSKGINGVVLGSKPVTLAAGEYDRVQSAALEWFQAVADEIGPAVEDRGRTVAGSPAVLAAIGAMGHALVNSADSERPARRMHALGKLRGVRWDKGDHWVGLAGKKTPKGKFSVGGPKEYAHLAYAALTAEANENYARIRS